MAQPSTADRILADADAGLAHSTRTVSKNHDVVLVYVLTADSSSTEAQLVADLFENPPFVATLTTVNMPTDVSKHEAEWHRIRWALTNSRSKGAKYTIVVKDSTVSSSSPADLARLVETVIQTSKFDVFYLCKWQDRCDLYNDRQSLSDTTSSLVKTQSPHGTQALMFSESGRDIMLGDKPMRNGKFLDYTSGSVSDLLNKAITEGNLVAHTVTPNACGYNSSRAKNNGDYGKTQECVSPPVASPHSSDMDFVYTPDVPVMTSSVLADKPLTPRNGTFFDTVKVSGKKNSTSGWIMALIIVLLIVAILSLVAWLVRRSRM